MSKQLTSKRTTQKVRDFVATSIYRQHL